MRGSGLRVDFRLGPSLPSWARLGVPWFAQCPCPLRQQIPAVTPVGLTQAASASQRQMAPSEGVARASSRTHMQFVLCAYVRAHVRVPREPFGLYACQHGCERGRGEGSEGEHECTRQRKCGPHVQHTCACARVPPSPPRFYSSLLPLQKCLRGLGWNNSLMQTGNFLKRLNTQQIGKRTMLLKREDEREEKAATCSVADVLYGDARCVRKRISGLCPPLGERLRFPSKTPFVEKLWTPERVRLSAEPSSNFPCTRFPGVPVLGEEPMAGYALSSGPWPCFHPRHVLWGQWGGVQALSSLGLLPKSSTLRPLPYLLSPFCKIGHCFPHFCPQAGPAVPMLGSPLSPDH